MTTVASIVQPLQLSDGEVRFYKDEGYLVIPGLLNAEFIDAMRAEVLDVMETAGATPESLRQATHAKHKLIQSGQYLAGSHLDEFINSPDLLSIAEQLMGGPATLYMPFTAVKSGGGGGRFHFHQDNQYTRHEGHSINIWFALSPMSPENGCLQVVPRSHLNGTRESVGSSDGDGHRMVAQEPDRFLPLRMHPGDAVAFSRLTIHGSGPNHTDEARLAYAVQFHRNDTTAFFDGESKLLTERPRFNTKPVAQLSKPQVKSQDGH
jgi:2-oxoglutarate-dependent dioxygenase